MLTSVSSQTSAKRILIVGDDRAVSGAFNQLLTHYGFRVTLTPTLRDADQQSLDNHDLIVLDVTLPDGSGLELLKNIRSAGLKPKVFILTGNVQANIEREIRHLKPTRRFQKPLDFLELLESIRSEFPEN